MTLEASRARPARHAVTSSTPPALSIPFTPSAPSTPPTPSDVSAPPDASAPPDPLLTLAATARTAIAALRRGVIAYSAIAD